MARTHRVSQRPWRRVGALLLIALMALTLVPVFAQDGPPDEPLLPNIEPEPTAELQAVQSEEQMVMATLADYAANEAAVAAMAELPAEAFLQQFRYRVFLPQISRSNTTLIPPAQNPTPTPQPPTPQPPAPQPNPDHSADVVVSVRATPSILVRPGQLLTYTFTLRNMGNAEARETKIYAPVNRQQITPVNTSLSSKAGDWLSENGQERFVVVFGPLAKGATRSGKVVVRVANNLPIQPSAPVRIDMRAKYSWGDGNSGGAAYTNWAPVLIGNSAVHADFVWLRVTPDRAPAGTPHVFYSNRFLPDETVSAWVNVNRGSGGVRALNIHGTANANGEVELRIRSTDTDPALPRGTHQIVLAGQRSGLQGMIDFIVQ